MSPVRVRGTAAAPHVSEHLRLQLRDAVDSISEAAGIPREIVREHLDQSVLRALEVLGESYVTEMGAALERVGALRQAVHGYYERALAGQLDAAGMAGIREALERLRDADRQLVAPDVWARRRRLDTGVETAPVRDPIEGEDTFDIDVHRPAGSPTPKALPGDPAAPPRWAERRVERRIAELPEHVRGGFARARVLRRSVVDAALRGEPGAAIAMLEQLRGVLDHQELAQAWEAVAVIRTPDLPYALGGGLRGSRPLSAPVQAAFHALPAAEQVALSRAVAADPEFVRAVVGGEAATGTAQGTPVPWRPEEMDRFCAEHGIAPDQRAELERALISVNRGHTTGRAEVEAGVGASPDALSRAVLLDDQAVAFGLPSAGKVAEALRGSALLRDFGTRNPDHLLALASAWLQNAAERVAKEKTPIPLETYVRDVIMTSHVRGMFGEFGAVFQLGKDLCVLKAPDIRVTEGGTDFVVMVKTTGEIWLCDNKTLSSAGLGEVSSLVENLAQNVEADVATLSVSVQALTPKILSEEDGVFLPSALARLRTASAEVNAIVGGLSAEQIRAPGIQARVAAVLERPDVRIRRVITNAGGELTYLQKRLHEMKVDLANLRSADPVGGMRPLGTTPERPVRRRRTDRGGTP